MGNAWYIGGYGTIQLLCKNDLHYVLNGWDGKVYTDCYKSDMRGLPINTEEKFIVKPILTLVSEKFDLYETGGYEVIQSTK
ncbi:MAG: hypothetical protein ACRC1P_09545 [Cellulosilyticaceae bacterium]